MRGNITKAANCNICSQNKERMKDVRAAFPKGRRKAEGEKLKAEEFEVRGALARGFECLTSDFRLQTSDFRLQTSDFPLYP